jgi:hypothetical protein
VLASHADEPLTVKPALGTGSRLIALDGTEITAGVNLDPFGINLLKWPEMAASGAQGLTGSQVAHGRQRAW